MRIGDKLIQRWRMQVAARWIPQNARVLDIGCHQGEFLFSLGERIKPSVGFDPLYKQNQLPTRHQFVCDVFREGSSLENHSFDAVVMLATIEHLRDKAFIAREASRLLRPGGRVIITVPSPLVDKILGILLFLHLVDGMSLEEHHGFKPDELPAIFRSEGFRLAQAQKFQLGLNNLYVFERL